VDQFDITDELRHSEVVRYKPASEVRLIIYDSFHYLKQLYTALHCKLLDIPHKMKDRLIDK
jgi:hypothetical protein